VIRRASELLAEFEQRPQGKRRVQAAPQPEPPSKAAQLSLFDIAPNPAIEMLRRLNINELSPIEAMTKLYELQQLALREG